MPPHSKQHFVAQSYLKAWGDPAAPVQHTPYVWSFAKDGNSPRKRAPSNLFRETDLYTIKHADGQRDLTLEHGLSQIESEFARIRRDVLEQHCDLGDEDRYWLCLFIAAARTRTPAMRTHVRDQWAPVMEYAEHLRRRAARGERMAPSFGGGRRMSMREVEDLVAHPLPPTVVTALRVEAPILMGMDMAIVDTADSPGFITSDDPCAWFDPEACKRPPMFQALALGYRSIEVTLPVSPRQTLLLNRLGRSGYFTMMEDAIDDLNRRTRWACNESFVVNANITKPIWFDEGEEPDDSWRRRHERADCVGDDPDEAGPPPPAPSP